VEGGGDDAALKSECRHGFTVLLERAGLKGRMPRVIACGGRRNAYEQYCKARDNCNNGDNIYLLVDSEAPVVVKSPWDHVKNRAGDEWTKPAGSNDDQLHLMVQCMESWFLADRKALKAFFGQGFQDSGLPAAAVEAIEGKILCAVLESATKNSKTKAVYHKGRHSFKLLALIDPKLIRKASPWAERFFSTLENSL